MTAHELLHRRGGSISSTCRVKKYPDGSLELLACSEQVFRPEGWEASKKRVKGKSPNGDDQDSTERAMRRARAQVKDLALCTPFRFFVTLTLNQEKIDRYDMGEITKKLNRWLDNQVRRRGLAYVLVPERHKDGAIHFHGFFNDALEVKDSGHKDCKGHTVYNLPGWTLGFTTAIELYGDYRSAVGYVCKYIGKQGEKIGGRWYYSGGDLGRPEVSYADISFRELEALEGAYVFAPEGSGLAFAMVQVPPGEEGRECDIATSASITGSAASIERREVARDSRPTMGKTTCATKLWNLPENNGGMNDELREAAAGREQPLGLALARGHLGA